MEKSNERNIVCKYCNKTFPSGKSLGGHIRIHTNEYSVDSGRYNGKKKKKKLVNHQREIVASKQQRKQLTCRECGKEFVSLKALSAHEARHFEEGSQSDDTETSSAPTRKRSKRVMKLSNSESFSNGSSSFGSEIDQECKNGAYNLMMMSSGSSFKKGYNFMVNSLAESSDNNSAIVETKSSSGEELKILNVKKNQVLETDKVAVDDQLRSADDNNGDSSDSDSDYFMNGPKKSESDISVDGSLRNNGFNNNFLKRFRDTYEEGSKYELSRRRSVLPSYESLETETNSKIRRSSDSKSAMVKKASGGKKKSKDHECPTCFKLFKSGQALGGHKRSHNFVNQEHNQVAEMRNQIDLNVPASDID
ncbi:Zinc finger protein ZAT4 [Cardamine amara subsp. amara]|uniref:Zinc finger protein ZAT4 n=1 Tax=Cardamine amara subsp. amara TaxID=228776 RepID=A0ABD1AF93_CARAN